MAVTEATRLLARGAEVTLGGKPYRLTFDFEALCLLEEEMGGLDVFAEHLMDGRQRLRTCRSGMVAALAHTGMSRAEIVKQLRYADAGRYLAAMRDAFIEALPEPDEDPKVEGSPSSSPGDATTTSSPSSSDAVPASSGV